MSFSTPGTATEAGGLSPLLRSVLPRRLGIVHTLSTKSKSVVLRVDTPGGALVAKGAPPSGLLCDKWIYGTLLPIIGLPGPALRGWVEESGEAWLVIDFIEGRRPVLWEADDAVGVSKWLARMHCQSRRAGLVPPPGPWRPSAESQLAAFAASLADTCSTGSAELDACSEVQAGLPLVWGAAAELPECVVHGDLSDWNLLLTDDAVIALDWERVAWRTSIEDLAVCNVAAYGGELSRLGVDVEPTSLIRGQNAGIVLACLSHDLPHKPAKTQRHYLRRMLTAISTLRAEG